MVVLYIMGLLITLVYNLMRIAICFTLNINWILNLVCLVNKILVTASKNYGKKYLTPLHVVHNVIHNSLNVFKYIYFIKYATALILQIILPNNIL